MPCAKLNFRKAEADDSRFVWKLANDSQVREVSFSSRLITWQDHQVWFTSKLQDQDCLFYIVENAAGEKMAQVRFELKNENWVISLSIVQQFRGHGLGSVIIKSVSGMLFNIRPEVNKIFAYIKNENIPSIRAFEKSNYQYQGRVSIKRKNDAVLMILERTK